MICSKHYIYESKSALYTTNVAGETLHAPRLGAMDMRTAPRAQM